jgi:hypothetical protein
MRRTAVMLTMAAAMLTACSGTTLGTTPVAAGSGPTSSRPTDTPASQHSTHTESPVPVESPMPVESNPPGDIPDNTAFVPFHAAAASLTLTTPEGWARTNTSSSVTFTDKLNTVVVSWSKEVRPPSVNSAKATDVPSLKRSTRAFHLETVQATSLPAGPATLITYRANSDPDPVTGKQYRLDVLRYELYHAGTQVNLTLLSPVGADNVDPWRTITESLKWDGSA